MATTITPPGLNVNLSFTGTPTNAGSYSVTATVNDLNYTGSATATLVVGKAAPIITWSSPAAIAYGTALSATQLDATANIPGTFVYMPASGAVLAAGTQNLTATFTPADATDYTSAPANVSLTVNKALPTIIWAQPAAIVYGTALSTAQLDATASVPGSFAYNPTTGTVLAAGTQSLAATFTPTDAADYTTAPANVSLTVNKATAAVTFDAGTLSRTYSGTQKTVATTTTPPGLTVNLSFTGTPTNVGATRSPPPSTMPTTPGAPAAP